MQNFANSVRGARFFDRFVPALVQGVKSVADAIKENNAVVTAQTEALKRHTESVEENTKAIMELQETMKWCRH